MSKTLSYKDSGVDVDSGNQFVEDIKPLANSTHRQGVLGNIGGFGALFDLKSLQYRNPILVSSTDGVGTKLELSIACNKYNTIGVDLVAMCVNDIVVQGAEPLFFLDYFATGKLEHDTAKEIISGISDGCRTANVALIGGETAEMPDIYVNGRYDLAGFAVGVVERDAILPRSINEGDILIGISASGFHANGYSLVRKVIAQNGIDLLEEQFNDQYVYKLLLEPTKIYVKLCLDLINNYLVNGLAHVTGGGILDNLPRILPNDLAAEIDTHSWQYPEVYRWFQKYNPLTESEMLRTFNCGVGMILVVSADNLQSACSILREHNEEPMIIGRVIKRQNEAVVF